MGSGAAPEASSPRVSLGLLSLVRGRLELDWSPTQIAQWLKHSQPNNETMRVSHETVSHRHAVLEAMARLKASLDVIDGKIADYELRLRTQSGIGQEVSVEIANER